MDDDVMKALELMIKEDKGRVVVTEKDRIIGLITRNGIARYVQIRERNSEANKRNGGGKTTSGELV